MLPDKSLHFKSGRVKLADSKVAPSTEGCLPVPTTVGANVRGLRLKRGLTQQQLADRADIAISTVTRIETDRHTPRLDVLLRVADTLGVASATLLRDVA